MRLNALQRLERYIGHWNSCDNNSYFFPASIPEIPRMFPAELFDNLTRIRFENREYMCARDTDKILSISYGDYMELPPEEERVMKHHPLVVDFEKNWDEIKNLDAKETQW